MVLGLRRISAAISLICLPDAISHITRYSRSESRLCGGFSPPSAKSVASFSAKAGLTYLPPTDNLADGAGQAFVGASLIDVPANSGSADQPIRRDHRRKSLVRTGRSQPTRDHRYRPLPG